MVKKEKKNSILLTDKIHAGFYAKTSLTLISRDKFLNQKDWGRGTMENWCWTPRPKEFSARHLCLDCNIPGTPRVMQQKSRPRLKIPSHCNKRRVVGQKTRFSTSWCSLRSTFLTMLALIFSVQLRIRK